MKLNEISSAFAFGKDGFEISEVPVKRILEDSKIGSPVFIYDAETIRKQYEYLRANLPNEIEIFYSMKANPNLGVLKLISELVDGMEIASLGELIRADKVGIKTENIVFAGPGKSDDELFAALKNGVYRVNVESMGELKRVSKIAQSIGKEVTVSLRINPKFSVSGASLNMGGGPKQFGIDEEQIDEAISLLKSLPSLKKEMGIHIFSASNVLSVEGFMNNLVACVELARRANDKIPVISLDVGAALGIPYTDGESNIKLAGLKERVSLLLNSAEFLRKNNVRIIVELGRFFVGQCGVYVSKIEDIKTSRGIKYIIVNGGVHNLTRIPLIKKGDEFAVHPLFNLSRQDNRTEKYHISGCLCTPVDILGVNRDLPISTMVGDLIGVFNAGAYGFSEGMLSFLSHDVPAEVLVDRGQYKIVNKRRSAEEMMQGEAF